ncbi:hypothetical protein GCM10025859_65360 [Alicyclobacillus fastidiosus]|nr:hypothetical protein GCM10025859_65360 [Alicyclobacillus fastidiosus]
MLSLGWVDGTRSSFIERAVATAKHSDVTVVYANDFETENFDRTSLLLPGDQNELIQAVAKANPNTVVVLNTGGPVLMPWLGEVKSVVEAWYPGQDDGNAIAAILFGDVDPSGHLPVTFPQSSEQMPTSTKEQYPGVDNQVSYSEGLDVGYRWYDSRNVKPLFPFGYGLSYTTFKYSNLKINTSKFSLGQVFVTVDVTNTGKRVGAAVPQLYIGDPQDASEPPRQLKGYEKILLNPGETKAVSFQLNARAFSIWNVKSNNWTVVYGTYTLMIGSSSENIALAGKVGITSGFKSNAALEWNPLN